ncbi:AAA family ATPase, partial [Streptosporangium vulgare]|uniref:AAA family ATPase n=1 Tax=Streptosporangium vulgare TaxID=46190 RepID=UPI003CD09CAB
MGYPAPSAELEMLDVHGAASPLDKLEPVATTEEVKALIEAVRGVYVSQPIKKYAIDLVTATRQSPDLRLGASPRSTLQLVRAARAHAALAGRDYVIPDDLQELCVPVLAHPAAAQHRGPGAAPPARAGDRRPGP